MVSTDRLTEAMVSWIVIVNRIEQLALNGRKTANLDDLSF